MNSGVWHGVFILWELLSYRNAGYLEKYCHMVFLYQKQVKIASQELLMGGDGDWRGKSLSVRDCGGNITEGKLKKG